MRKDFFLPNPIMFSPPSTIFQWSYFKCDIFTNIVNSSEYLLKFLVIHVSFVFITHRDCYFYRSLISRWAQKFQLDDLRIIYFSHVNNYLWNFWEKINNEIRWKILIFHNWEWQVVEKYESSFGNWESTKMIEIWKLFPVSIYTWRFENDETFQTSDRWKTKRKL